MQRIVSPTLAALLLAACSSSGGGGYSVKDIKATAPAGTINGMAWTLTTATIQNDGTNLNVNLFGDPTVASCAQFESSSSTIPFVLFTMPAQVGTRPLQLSLSSLTDPNNQTVTFVTPPSNNNVATDGLLDVSALDSASVTLGLVADAGQDSVNGTVTVALCP